MKNKILIVGAGPVGMAAALFLRSNGLYPRIIDRNTSIAPYSKALGINSRSLYLMNEIGVAERLMKQGVQMQGVRMHYNQKLIMRNPIADNPIPGNRYNFVLALPQSDTQHLLCNTLKERNIEIQRETELIDIHQNKSGSVQVELKNGNSIEKSSYDIVFAADGAHSLIRKKLNIPFPGHTLSNIMHMYDLNIKGIDIDKQFVHGYITQQDITALFPINKQGRYRILCSRTDYQNLLPTTFQFSKPVWETQFKLNHRVVDRFSQGNIYLAGDAAHVHSPLGGRGMNIGFQDAYVFSKLLKSNRLHLYSEYRLSVLLPLVKKIQKMTEAAFVHLKYRPYLPWIVPIAKVLGRKNFAQFITGLDHQIME